MAGKKCLNQKQLESVLQQLDTFQTLETSQPNAWHLEQYDTPPHIAAYLLLNVQSEYGDIEGKTVVDLGCGCGVLSVGCVLLGAKHVIGVDIDRTALDVACRNATEMNLTEALTFKQCDVCNLTPSCIELPVDTVVMNPPFGTKITQGVDRIFVEKALALTNTVYSIHKSSTRDYWSGRAATELGVGVTPLVQVKFNIDQVFRFHRKASVDVLVDLIRFHRPQKVVTSN